MANGITLSEKQRACLKHFASVDPRGAADGWKFGSGTLSSLRKAGLLERFKGHPWPGAHLHTMYRATDAGRALEPGVAIVTRPDDFDGPTS